MTGTDEPGDQREETGILGMRTQSTGIGGEPYLSVAAAATGCASTTGQPTRPAAKRWPFLGALIAAPQLTP